MISYNSSEVVQCLRQYDMFANSLNLVKTREEKSMIVRQLTKLEQKIIELTNEAYEEEYNTLANKECGLLNDEKNRLTMLIDLINQRLTYVEKRCNNHYVLTGESINVSNVLGADELDKLESRVRIIDKYSKNIKLEKELNEEVKSISSKIDLASEKIEINKSLNIELENTFKKVLNGAFERLNLYSLIDIKDDIEYAYSETEEALNLARANYETAKTSPINILSDCEKMLADITVDYDKYKSQVSILKLMEIYNSNVETYEELLSKRKEINEIMKYIKDRELLSLISDTVSKQYSTILMEEQDVNTYNDLVLEKDRKLEALSEIAEENNSDEFQSVLKVLIENENKRQARILEEQRKIEEEEKKKRLEVERKRQEEILKRQKLIEEARKKEMEKRTRQMLEEQQNSVLQPKRQSSGISFETIKDISDEEEKVEEVQEEPKELETREARRLDLNALKNEADNEEETKHEEPSFFSNKVDIEKDLFEEFNHTNDEPDEHKDDDERRDKFFDMLEEKVNDNKLPDMSIDEYMRNFDEEKVDDVSKLADFGDEFPTIPM